MALPSPSSACHDTPHRLQPDDLAALDALIASRPEPQPSRPDAIRQIVRTTLRMVGGDIDGKN